MKLDTERNKLRRLNRSLAYCGQFVSVSRTGKPARYLLRDAHSGNVEAAADGLEGWIRTEREIDLMANYSTDELCRVLEGLGFVVTESPERKRVLEELRSELRNGTLRPLVLPARSVT